MTGDQLALGEDARNEFVDVEVLDAELIVSSTSVSPAVTAAVELEQRNLFGEAERIAARAATPGTRRQYASIFRAFGDWLAGELGRPPVVGDLDVDAIAAYGRHLQTAGGRGGRPASPATVRVYLSMVRALARDLGRNEDADKVRVPQHEPAPPEAISDTEYANLLRVPDRRSIRGKRDYAVLRILGDCGLRGAELRNLRARDLRRPRANGRHFQLLIRGKGGRDRIVPVPQDTQRALDSWLKVHPLARGVAPHDEDPLFVRLGKHGDAEPAALSHSALYAIVNDRARNAGIPDRLAHPHALRTYFTTHVLESGVPIHEARAFLGHADIRTTVGYAVVRPDSPGGVVDIIDRRHQAARRNGHR